MSNIVEHLRDEAVKVMIERTGNTGLSSKDVTGSVIWKAAAEIERLRALTSPQLHQHGGGVEELRAALESLLKAADDFHDCACAYFSDTTYDGDGNLAQAEAALSVSAIPDARAALAQQPLSVPMGRKPPELLTEAERKEILTEAELLWKDLQENKLGGFSDGNRQFYILYEFKRVIEKYGHRDVGLTWSKDALDALPAHPTQCDVSCSRAREGGTGE